jgi:branched-chain amino acid transport system ATP-binding protein
MASSAEPILRTEGLARHYGGVRALNGVDLRIEPGLLHAVIGPNGAGKSTLFHVITGRVPASNGRIWFRGQDITGRSQPEIARLGVARSYQITTVFPRLTVHENVRVAAQVRTSHTWVNFWRPANAFRAMWERADEVLEMVGLDEPTAGMSPLETEQMMYLIRDLGRKVSVVLVEHKMNVVMGVSDRITVLHFGSVLTEGTPQEVRANPRVQEVYLEGSI